MYLVRKFHCIATSTVTKTAPKILPLLSIFDFDACYEGSTGGQIGVEYNQKSTGDVGFFPALLLADQSEAENANFLVI